MSAFAKEEWQLTSDEVYPRCALSGFQLAPDGQRLSFVHQRGAQIEETLERERKKVDARRIADLCLMPSGGGFPQPLTDSGDASQPAVWSPDGRWLAFERGPGLQIVPAAGGAAKTIYRGKLYHPPLTLGDASCGYPRWSPDGESILFAVREEPQTTLRLTSPDGRWQRELISVEGYIISWDWAPDGRQIVLVARDEDGWVGDIRLLDIETGKARILWGEANYEYQKPVAAWVPGGDRFVFRSNRSGWAKLWAFGPGMEEPEAITQGEWDDYAFRLSPDGQLVVYASRAGQKGSGDDLWISPLSPGESTRLTRHLGINVPLAWSKDNQVYYWHSSPTEPGDLWRVSAMGGEPSRLTWNAPLELEQKLAAPEEVSIVSEDGTEIWTLIYRPAYYREGDRYPAIVWIRGGPTGVSRVDCNPFYNWLANLGYVVITPNYRGSIGHGVQFMAAVSGEGLGKNDLSDVLAAGRYVKTLPDVDLSRGVGVGGRSWGGYLALMAVTQAPSDFSCGVAGAAISDWRIQQAQTEVRYYDRWLVGGWVYEQEDRARERSPVSFVEHIQVPLLVYHGEEDRDVPFAQIESFVAEARRAGVQVEYKSYSGEGHNSQDPKNQRDSLDLIRAFLRKHLQPWNLRDHPCADQVQ